MKNLLETKVGAVVSKDYRTARVFSAHGIDFCCKGGITVAEACARNEADEQKLKAEIEQLLAQQESPDDELLKLSLPALIDHILANHHIYIRETAPLLEAYLLKIANVHGQRHPELINLYSLFRHSHHDLQQHMVKEEQILFPIIRRVAEQQQPFSPGQRDSLAAPIAGMEHEHTIEGDRFREMRTSTANFTPPADACQTYRVAFKMLEEFEMDLHRHIHLENNVLFVRAQKLVTDKV